MTQELLERIVQASRPRAQEGKLATYIPQLQEANPAHLGLAVATPQGEVLCAGEASARFTIQSVSKVFIFTCALLDAGPERLLQKVSIEPTADAFDSITALETKNFNRPLNPFLNAGAIACLTEVAGGVGRVLDFCRALSGNAEVIVDEAVYKSEKDTGARNRALAYFMKSTGVIEGDVEALLDSYFQICAISMDCRDLARCALAYALHGCDAQSARHFPKGVARAVVAAMAMCGMYDESGTVATQIGLPCKSGVGGGIMAAAPGRYGIAAFSPPLNAKGSSVAGLAALEALSAGLDLSVY